jgi:hypothetical protein
MNLLLDVQIGDREMDGIRGERRVDSFNHAFSIRSSEAKESLEYYGITERAKNHREAVKSKKKIVIIFS